MPDISIDDALKLTQIAFYIIAGTIGVLTYRSAKKGLLNTVNTEYHKKVIERLRDLADQLADEFIRGSPNYWAGSDSLKRVIDRVNMDFQRGREFFLEKGEFKGPILVSDIVLRLDDLIWEIKSDPFVPKELRDLTMDLL